MRLYLLVLSFSAIDDTGNAMKNLDLLHEVTKDSEEELLHSLYRSACFYMERFEEKRFEEVFGIVLCLLNQITF